MSTEAAMNLAPVFLLTIDVEDWFQVENFKSAIPFSSWEKMELRVEKNTHRLLDLFDSIAVKNTGICATFFVLGWIAERLPDLVREIKNRGHDVASHGFCHHLCANQDKIALQKDLLDSKKLLEEITGSAVYGYRAPSFSVSDDIIKVVEDAGYRYDASYNSFDKHGRYGKLLLNGSNKYGIAYKVSDSFYEVPVSNLTIQNLKFKIQNFTLPWGGGGYFRLMPLPIFKMGVKKILQEESAYHFYLHPWEIDPDQPRVKNVSGILRFRHYVNIRKNYDKLKSLLNSFSHCRFQSLNQYLNYSGI